MQLRQRPLAAAMCLTVIGVHALTCLFPPRSDGQSGDLNPAKHEIAATNGPRAYADFAMYTAGNADRGRAVFTNTAGAACVRCHTLDGSSGKVAPDLFAIADKFSRQDLIRSVLEPSATIAIGYETTLIETRLGEEFSGVIKQATADWVELMGWDAQVYRVPIAEIVSRKSSQSSFMPSGLEQTMTHQDFADLIAYLETLHQVVAGSESGPGPFLTIPQATHAVALKPYFGSGTRFSHPLWFGQVPGQSNRFVVLEHAGKSWVIERTASGDKQTTLVDLSKTVRFGGATGLLGLAFHPDFERNRRYFLNYQVLDQGRIYTLLVARHFSAHRDGVCVTGGFVYRGSRAPGMQGRYICGDYETRRIWALTQTNRQLASLVEIGRAPTRISSFGQDTTGELVLVGYDDGIVYHLDLSKVDPAPLQTRVLAETSELMPVRWRYSLAPPPGNWTAGDYDDSTWNYAPGGFGTRGTPGAIVRTEWNTDDIWLRRRFELDANSAVNRARSIVLRLHHDEDVEVYLNGSEAVRLPRWTSGYIEVPLNAQAIASLRTGTNVIAVHCHQTSGGQYVDAGLTEYLRPAHEE